MKTLALLISAVFLVAATQIVRGLLAPEAVITVEALSYQELHDLGWTGPASNGLKTVGKGELVYLSAANVDTQVVTAYTWSLSGPPGSSATLDSTSTQWTTFRPDTTGTFTVDVTINTTGGSASASAVITSANYVGVGNVAGPTPRFGCSSCHSANAAAWLGTRHSTKFSRDIDGGVSFYADSCLRCHTVGYNEDPTAKNEGFDDLAIDQGWVIPDTLQPGNWDAMSAAYPDLAHKANIQCENCHGAGSEHVTATTDRRNRIQFTADPGVCFRCHDDEPFHPKGIQWRASSQPSSIEELRDGGSDGGHARGVTFASTRSTGNFKAAEGFGCNGCHSAYGFINRTDPASALRDESGAPLVTGAPEISCATCHDPHDATNDHQLRRVDDVELANGEVISFGGHSRLCMNCHKARENAEEYVLVEGRTSFRGPHHGPQTEMFAGTGAFTFGRVLPSSTHKDVLPDLCVSCHMFETPADGEPGHNLLGGHSWNMSIVEVVGTDTVETNHVSRCRTCHEPDMQTFEDRKPTMDYDGDGVLEGAQQEVHGLMEQVAMLLQPVGLPEVDQRAGGWSLMERKALYNYLFVEEDQSMGMHNFQFTVNLLMLTRDVLTYGVLTAGEIVGIQDVPNDQGFQLGVAWSRFGGDGASETPLQDYYVWRRVDTAQEGKVNGKTLDSFDDVPVPTGDTGMDVSSLAVVLDGEVWTAVGHQPAAAMQMYSAVVPTLGGLTDTDTTWSVFVVSGHVNGAPELTVVSAPDSAYSVDNLVPTAPVLSATTSTIDVQLSFGLDRKEPRNVDFDHFAIYRSTEQGFDPERTGAVATTSEGAYQDADVVYGVTYYYRAAAFDLNGNRGDFSDQVSAAVGTNVDGTGDIPTTFELYQNYPNPFNPSTVIAFDVPNTSDVRMIVYDLLGRQVQTLVSGSLSAGKHRVTFDASHLSSGLYVLRLFTPAQTFERMVLLTK